MPRTTIDRPIINSPYEEPARHWRDTPARFEMCSCKLRKRKREANACVTGAEHAQCAERPS